MSDGWMAITGRLRLRLLRAGDAAALGSVMEPALVAAAVAHPGNRALTPWAIVVRDGGRGRRVLRVLRVDSYLDEDGQRDIYRR